MRLLHLTRGLPMDDRRRVHLPGVDRGGLCGDPMDLGMIRHDRRISIGRLHRFKHGAEEAVRSAREVEE